MRKILIVAYACEPLKGSEQGVGWNWSLEVAQKNKVCVITRTNNKSIIEKNIPENIKDNISFYYYDTNPIFLKLKKKAKGLYFYYTLWQIGVLWLIKKLNKQKNFDYIFQPTMGSIWMPSFLSFTKTPFIWGPLGGGECVPYTFLKTLPFKDRVIQSSRYLLKYSVFFNPILLFSLYRAQIILVRTPNTMKFIPSMFRKKTYEVLETAMENEIFKYKKTIGLQNKIQIIITARLIPIKNILATLEAFYKIPKDYNLCLTIVGSGSEKEKINKLIAKNPENHEVILTGALPRDEVLKLVCESDIYLFPSLHEGGSWALMEAMAIGLPVICLNWTGNAIITDKSSAIQLEVTNPETFIHDMMKAICILADKAELREKIGNAARKRIRENFNWEQKGVFMEKTLQKLDLN